METIQISIKEWMDKQNVEYQDTGILVSNNEEWYAHTCYNLDEPSKCYAESKKPVTQIHILYDPNCMEI